MAFPPAYPHGELREVFDDVFFVTGLVRMAPLMGFSRNMVVVRDGERLVAIHSMRLNDEGHAALDKLGKVTDVVRLAGFHGMDDPFYKERYGAKIWALPDASYQKGFDAAKTSENPYFKADEALSKDADLPLSGASLFTFATKPAEGMLLLERDGGILVSGDALQNWGATNEYFTFMGKVVMKVMGFIKPHNLGPGWIKAAKPETAEVHSVLDLEFDHVLPVHGDPVVGGAKGKYRDVIKAYGSS